MSTLGRWAVRSALLGVGATATMDASAEVVRRTTGVAPLDYRLLARWIGHMREGRFSHDSIADAAPIPGEEKLGLLAHYSIGIGFAGLLLAWRPGFAERPSLGPAMAIGMGTIVAPWFVMQPAFGLGVAAAKTPDPTAARLRSLRTHATYGLGLYLTGQVLRRACR